MNQNYFATIAIITITIVSGCSSARVISDIDHTEDFTQFKTFEFLGWANDSDKALNRFDKERIESAFAKEATARGITRSDSDGDVLARLFVTGEMKTERTAHTTSMGMGGMGGMGMGHRGMRSPGWGWGTTHGTTVITENNYVEGTLVIELFDRTDKKLIWQAMGTQRVNENPDKRAKDIQKKVGLIMRKYPVSPAKK